MRLILDRFIGPQQACHRRSWIDKTGSASKFAPRTELETSVLKTRSRSRTALAAAILGIVAAMTGPGTTPAAAAIGSGFVDNFDSFTTSRWYKADGYSNGGMFNAG